MAIRLYDEALTRKIQDWITAPNLRVLKPDEVMRLRQLGNNDNDDEPMKLPTIALSRTTDFTILQNNRKPMSYDGLMLDANKDKSLQLNAIPITLTYQLDIYTAGYAEGDEYLRNFIFNFVNDPSLTITIPYNNINIKHNSSIELDATVSDNSDIPERLFPGQFTRWTLRFDIVGAYLFSLPYVENVSISDYDLEVRQNSNKYEKE